MGMAMALNLIKAGFELTGFDLRQERLDMLKEAGGKPASSPAEAAQGADAVFIMVMTGAQAEAVVHRDLRPRHRAVGGRGGARRRGPPRRCARRRS